MKPAVELPELPGETPWSKLDRAFRTVITVPNYDLRSCRIKFLRCLPMSGLTVFPAASRGLSNSH